MGDEGLRQAEQMVQEGNEWGVVRNGVVILGELGGERAVAQLMDTIQHHKSQVRRETISALARIGGEGAILLLMGRLEDEDEGVRATAARALGNLGSERVVRTLLARLDQEDSDEVLQEILRALGQLGDPGAVPAIEKRAVGSFLRRRSPPAVRVAAYRALSLIGTPHARQLIEAATEDRDPEVRALARSLAGRS
jgi:HEAT repeat protein